MYSPSAVVAAVVASARSFVVPTGAVVLALAVSKVVLAVSAVVLLVVAVVLAAVAAVRRTYMVANSVV